MNFLKKNAPYSLAVEGGYLLLVLLRSLLFQNQLGIVISNVVEHAYCCQVVVNIVRLIASVLVDSMENGDEIILSKLVNVVAHYQFETSEACGYNLVIVCNFAGLANGDNDDPPPIIFQLLSTSLYDLLNAL